MPRGKTLLPEMDEDELMAMLTASVDNKIKRANKVIITGDREWTDITVIKFAVKSYLEPGGTLVHGGARGADTIAGEVASQLGCTVLTYPAEWHMLGGMAGLVRNELMVVEHGDAGYVLAFHDDLLGSSRGTFDMVYRVCIPRGLRVVLFEHTDDCFSSRELSNDNWNM